MVASGKSSNRHSEERRAAHSGSGHGIYAAAGIREYQRNRAVSATSAKAAVSVASSSVRAPQRAPLPLSILGIGFAALMVGTRIIRKAL